MCLSGSFCFFVDSGGVLGQLGVFLGVVPLPVAVYGWLCDICVYVTG